MSNLSFLSFVLFYNDEFNREISQPQYKFCKWFDTTDDEKYRILQCYRESGKSDTLRLWVAWKLLCDPTFTVIIVSATNNIAMRNSREIKSIIENFSLTKHLKPKDPQQWQNNAFTIIRQHGIGDPSVCCTSVSASNTGLHAKLLLGDDVEVAENIMTEENREYLWDRVGAFSSLCSTQLFCGTPHTSDTIYNKLMNLPNGFKLLKIPVYNEDGTPANPDVKINGWAHDETWINFKRQSHSPGQFASQYMLEAVESAEPLFDFELISTYSKEIEAKEWWDDNDKESTLHTFNNIVVKDIAAYWDPAMGLKNRDESVLAIVFRTVDGQTYIHRSVSLPAISKEDGFQNQCTKVVKLLKRYFIDKVHVEENFQVTLAQELREAAMAMGVKVKVIGRRRLQNKNEFIAENIGPLINSGKLNVAVNVWKGAFHSQLKDFPRGKRHDDHIDAVAGAISELKNVKGKQGSDRFDNVFGQRNTVKQLNTPARL